MRLLLATCFLLVFAPASFAQEKDGNITSMFLSVKPDILNDLTEKSDIVLLGRGENSRPFSGTDNAKVGPEWTVVRFSVLDVYKSNSVNFDSVPYLSQSPLQVVYFFVKVNELKTYFNEGELSLVFLKKEEVSPFFRQFLSSPPSQKEIYFLNESRNAEEVAHGLLDTFFYEKKK